MLQPTPFPAWKWTCYTPCPPSLTSKPWQMLSRMTLPRKEEPNPSLSLRSQYPPVMPLSSVTHQSGPPTHWSPFSPAARCSMPSIPSRILVFELPNGWSPHGTYDWALSRMYEIGRVHASSANEPNYTSTLQPLSASFPLRTQDSLTYTLILSDHFHSAKVLPTF